MATKRIADEPAYVLHRYDWSESSLILDVFTRQYGRIALVAPSTSTGYPFTSRDNGKPEFAAMLVPPNSIAGVSYNTPFCSVNRVV